MKEHFLAFAWKHRLWASASLKTTNGRPLIVEKVGIENHDAGPDFREAQIKIDGLLWNGSVEIHIRASDWLKHGHQNDPSYDKTILHVVYEADREILRPSGTKIPCLELKYYLNSSYWVNYVKLRENKHWLACRSSFSSVSPIVRSFAIQKMAIERLISKADALLHRLKELGGDWVQLSFEQLLRGMGFKVNSIGMEQLARSLDVRILMRESHDLLRTEALLFGQANLLPDLPNSKYAATLWRTYQLLRSKYDLVPINKGVLQFLRTRPSNFPTIRLAQLAVIMHKAPHLPQTLPDISSEDILRTMLTTPVSEYWQHHYDFEKQSRSSRHVLSRKSIELLMINVVAPLQMAFGVFHHDEARKTRVASWTERIKAEDNKIIRSWKAEGVTVENALFSQGLLHLRKKYCEARKCLDCPIGQKIIRNVDESEIAFP